MCETTALQTTTISAIT